MATKQIPQIDRAIKEWGVVFRKAVKEVNKTIEEARKEWNEFESEEKSMLYNVTVKHEENKELEKYWLLRAIKDGDMYGQPQPTLKRVISEQELDHEPTPHEIAQFLSDSKADLASVARNYRFESELTF